MLIGVIAEELLEPLSVKPGRFIDGPFGGGFGLPDTFGIARIYQIGFIAPGLVDETDLTLGVENFFHTYVTNGYQGIFPDLFDDTVPEVFYDFSYSFNPVLKPLAWHDSEFFYSATIPFNPPLSPSIRYVDPEIFYTPTFLSPVAPNLVIDSDVIRAQVIRRDGDAIVLLLETFNDVDTFFEASIARALAPAIVNEHFPTGDVIYAAGQAAFLLPPAFSSVDSFFAPFIFNQLNPSRVLDSDIFVGPNVGTPGRLDLFVDNDIFFVSSVQLAALTPSLVTDTDTFMPSVIGDVPLHPIDFTIDFDDTFAVPVVTMHQGLVPHFWPDIDVVYAIPAVILGQGLAPSIFSDVDAFYTPVLPLTLSPALFAPADIFFAPVLIFDQLLQPSWLIDTDTYYAPSVVNLALQTITPNIFTDTDAFLAPSLTALVGFDGALSLDGPIMPATPQPTVILIEG